MRRYRLEEDDESSLGSIFTSLGIGALAGFAVGVVLSQKMGGLSGLVARFRGVAAHLTDDARGDDEYDELDESEEGEDTVLEERVLEAFRNDPVLSERAIDIGGLDIGIIELSGWVDSDHEVQHAATIARGTPGVETVVNRLAVGEEDELLDDEDDLDRPAPPAEPGAAWEGQRVGTGRRRQGRSDEPDRHADPRTDLEDRWLSEREAVRQAADEVDSPTAQRGARRGRDKGVPRADHVDDPESGGDKAGS